jgi:DNA (cytosine-5)-methyltransferase 1
MTDDIDGVLDVSNHSVIDLFAGPGGLDVAATWLGLKTHGIEWDPAANATRRNASLNTTEGDVRKYGRSDFPHATVLAGGPPCQTFTVAGSGTGRASLQDLQRLVGRMAVGQNVSASLALLKDERSGLILEPLRWVLEALNAGRPFEAVVLEQVQAALPVWQVMAPVLEAFGYHVECAVLRTEEFGVPQTRRRAVLLANRTLTPRIPVPTHQRYRKGVSRAAEGSTLSPWVTMSDALARSGRFEVISNYGTGGVSTLRGRRTSAEPSATITGKISRNRVVDDCGRPLPRFSPREAGMLQTFPVDFPWSEPGWAQQVGNAVPPRLGAHLLAGALGVSLDAATMDSLSGRPWFERDCSPMDVDVISDPSRVAIAAS